MSQQEPANEGIQDALRGWPQREQWEITAFYQPQTESFVLRFKHRNSSGGWDWMFSRKDPDTWPFVPEDIATDVRSEVRAVVLDTLRHLSETHGWPVPSK